MNGQKITLLICEQLTELNICIKDFNLAARVEFSRVVTLTPVIQIAPAFISERFNFLDQVLLCLLRSAGPTKEEKSHRADD